MEFKILSLATWRVSPRSFAILLIVAVIAWMVGYVLQLPFRYLRLFNWRNALQANAKADMEVIQDLTKRFPMSEISPSLDRLARGKLIWNDATQNYNGASSSDDVTDDEAWIDEPGGFHRLRLLRRWESQSGQALSATLIRRYSDSDVSFVVGHPAFLAHLCGLFGGLTAFVLLRYREQSKRETDWIQRVSSRIAMQEESLKAAEWQGVREAFVQSVYALTDSMKKRIAAVQETHERSSQAMKSMPIGILTFNEKLKLDFANPAGKALLDIEYAEIGQRLIEVIRIPAVFDLIMSTHQSGVGREIEFQVNQVRTLRLKAIPIRSDRDVTEMLSEDMAKQETSQVVSSSERSHRVLVSITDETRLKQLENLRRDFTANVSHELKTPLAAIKAYAETLLMGAMDDSDARRHFIGRIEEQAVRLEALIADLLQLSRLQSQPDKPPLRPIAIADVLKSCVDDHAAIAERRGVTVKMLEVEGLHVHSDLQSLQMILANIVSNAIRYNKEDGKVFISAKQQNGECIVRVEDTGIGIPPEDLDRIFERFYRVEKARSQETGGTGLGLSIVKHLCQLISAKLRVSSQLGTGSVFEISLPLPP